MNSVKGPVATYPPAADLPLPHLLPESVMSSLRALIVALMVTLAGCAAKERPPEPPAPPVVVPESTWRRIDSDIFAASLDATGQATNYAHDTMQRWMDLVYQRTDADFIPWYSSYWTRQWLTMKVTWYKLNAGGEKDPTVERLAVYLQEQYHERVLEPVAEEIDPDRVMEQATQLYVQVLGKQVRGLPQRYGVPLDQFDRRLKEIPAIALAPPPSRSASLYQLVRVTPFDELPAYAALVDQIHHAPGNTQPWSSDAGISSVAQRTSESLVTELATSGVASALSSIVGRAAGMVISLGAAGVSAIMRENDRPKMEAQLRKNLHAAFEEEWLNWMRNPDTGVLAGVYHISGQVEGSLADSVAQPIRYEPPAQTAPLTDEQPLQIQHGSTDDEGPYRLW